MSADKQRAFEAIQALVSHFNVLSTHYYGLLPDDSGFVDPTDANGIRREWLAALAGDYSQERLAERISDVRAAAKAAGIPFGELESRLNAVLDIAAPLFRPRKATDDRTLVDRLQRELNALIALRDYHCLEAARSLHRGALTESSRTDGDRTTSNHNPFSSYFQFASTVFADAQALSCLPVPGRWKEAWPNDRINSVQAESKSFRDACLGSWPATGRTVEQVEFIVCRLHKAIVELLRAMVSDSRDVKESDELGEAMDQARLLGAAAESKLSKSARPATPPTKVESELNLYTFVRQLENEPDNRELTDSEFVLLDASLDRPEIPNEMRQHESRQRVIWGTSCEEAIGKASRILACNRYGRHARRDESRATTPDRSVERLGGTPPSGPIVTSNNQNPVRHLQDCLRRLRLPMERLCELTDVHAWDLADHDRRTTTRELLGSFRSASKAYQTLRARSLEYLTERGVDPESSRPVVDRAAQVVSDFILPGTVLWNPPRLWLVNDMTASASELHQQYEHAKSKGNGVPPDALLRRFRESHKQAQQEAERHQQCVQLTIEMENLGGNLEWLLAGVRDPHPPAAPNGQPPSVERVGDAAASQSAAKAQIDADMKPRKLLSGWRAITDALDMKYVERKKVKSANERFQGPITNKGSGTAPMVYRDVLIDWWNKLAIQADESANRREGAQASAETQHNFGRDGTAAPEIGGGVKKRRQRKST